MEFPVVTNRWASGLAAQRAPAAARRGTVPLVAWYLVPAGVGAYRATIRSAPTEVPHVYLPASVPPRERERHGSPPLQHGIAPLQHGIAPLRHRAMPMRTHHYPERLASQSAEALTATEARNTTFEQSPLAWRGYSEEEVDSFVARAADALDATQRENTALRAEIDRLRNVYRRDGTDVDHILDRRPVRVAPTATRPLIVEAQQYVETQVAEADAYAAMVTVAAEHAEGMLVHAQLRAKIVTEEMVRAFLVQTQDRHRAVIELRHLQQWLRALSEALWRQTDAMALAVEAGLENGTVQRS
jgi:DivIVA domain-containing protein